ncbi:MAG: SsrA-binding protein [bacterium]
MLYYNKFAAFKYQTEKEYEAGMALTGSQVKEIRKGKYNLKESVVRLQKGELWAMHTGLSVDKTKLLLNRNEINKISAYLDEKRHQVFPLGIFQKGRVLKLKIGIGVTKKEYQKTEQQKRKDVKIEMAKAFKNKNFDY